MADFRERNLKITLRFALRFLKVRPRHWGLSPRLPRATWVCPQGYPGLPRATWVCPQGYAGACPPLIFGQGAYPSCASLASGVCPQGYAGACPPLIFPADFCPPLILSVVPF